MLGFTLTEEQLALQEKAREFAIREILPVARNMTRQKNFHLMFLKKLMQKVC